MDKHIKSVGQEMMLTYCQFIIWAMKKGYWLSAIFFVLALIAMPLWVAAIIGGLMFTWFTFWIITIKTIIKFFKLDEIEYV